jgi:hypothetical protein
MNTASEGTRSAQRINRASLTPDPLLLRTGLHRVDASQLTSAPLHEAHGAVEQRPCAPGTCQGLPTCSHLQCQGHPANQVTEDERDATLTRRVWAFYAATLAACGWAAWPWFIG